MGSVYELEDISPNLQALETMVRVYDIHMRNANRPVDPVIKTLWKKLVPELGYEVILGGVTRNNSGLVFHKSNNLDDLLPPSIWILSTKKDLDTIKSRFVTLTHETLSQNEEHYYLILYPVYVLVMHFMFRAFVKGFISKSLATPPYLSLISAESGLSPQVCGTLLILRRKIGYIGNGQVMGIPTDADISYLLSVYQQLVKLWLTLGDK